jgi:plastin-1
MWCNSLGVEGVYLNNLYDGIKDGIVLLKILDKIEPGSVNWSKCEKNPNHIIKKVANCN